MNILFIVKNIDIEHLNIMILSRILKDAGHNVMACKAKLPAISRYFKENSIDIVGYSVPTVYADFYLDLNRKIKQRYDVFSIFGGPHPTFCPEIIQDKAVDCVCRGEAEQALPELVEALSKGRDISKIKNLWVRQGGTIWKNEPRPLLTDLDKVPFADRYLFPFNETFYKRKMHVMASRGCPYDCSYCCHPAYDRLYLGQAKMIRRRSVENVIREIEEVLSKVELKLVMFEDDLFVFDKQWITDFCAEYKQRINVPFFCYVRADYINDELVSLLRSAGCISMSMGLETADENIRTRLLNRKMSNQQILKAAKIIKKAGIMLETTNIVGIPESSLEADFATLDMNIACGIDYSSVKLLAPYPGTMINSYARQKGIIREHPCFTNWTSALDFKDHKEKMATENLRKLFALGVAFPGSKALLKKAVYWPLGRLYTLINIFWEGYTAFFKLYPTGWRGFFWGIVKYFRIVKESVNV